MEKRLGSQLFNRQDDSKPKESILSPKKKQPCVLCGRNEESDSLAGELRHDPKSGLTIHNHCLYFAAKLCQKGDADNDDDPLAGFKPEDILAEKRRGSHLKCVYCLKNGATVGCCFGSRCKVSFHLPCGRENNTFHEFFGEHRSFCEKHVPELPMEKIRRKALTKWMNRGHGVFSLACHIQCRICFDAFLSTDRRGAVKATCCPNARFHFDCIQAHALKSGSYCFACPCCKDRDKFTSDVLACGVNIPTRDAAWEQENEFDDLLIRPNKCSAPGCSIATSSNHEGPDDDDLDVCDTCGSVAIHNDCRTLLTYGRSNTVVGKNGVAETYWTCPECANSKLVEASGNATRESSIVNED